MVQGSQHDISDGRKPCPRCKQRKQLSDFGTTKRALHCVSTYCKQCSNEMQQDRRNTPEGAQKHRDASKKWRLENLAHHAAIGAKWRYGCDYGTYESMLAAQNGECAICSTPEPGGNAGRFAIDHCHGSKVIRGLLCNNCNNGLGRFKYDPNRLQKAAIYLEMFLSKGGREGAK